MHLKTRLRLDYEQKLRLRVIGFVAVLIVLIPQCLNWRLNAFHARLLLETNESHYYLPSEQWLVPLSLGYREATAGMIWVTSLIYFGEQNEIRGALEFLEPYLVGVTTLDPYFYRAYTWGSMAAIYNGNPIDREGVELSIRMLERGLDVFPEDGRLHYYLGFQYYFELVPLLQGEEVERARRIGMDELCTSALLGGGPSYLPLVCSSLSKRMGMEHIAVERLLAILPTVEDERSRTQIEQRLEELMSDDGAFRALQQIDEQRRQWQRDMPYAFHGFYALTGPRGVFPIEDQIELPLPMDEMIHAAEEELFYREIHHEETSEELDSDEDSTD